MSKIKTDRNFRKNRSDKYQYLILESPCAPDILTEFSDLQGISGYYNSIEYSEELYELNEQLTAARWRLIRTKLTKRQREVIELYVLDGYTQTEIAKILKVNQSSVTKSLHGNCDYRNGKKVYGGAEKKLRRVAALDREIQKIKKRIAEIKQELL